MIEVPIVNRSLQSAHQKGGAYMRNIIKQLQISFLLEITNITRSVWIKVLGGIWILLLIYNFFLMLPQYKLLEDSLCLSGYMIQAIIFLGIFTGFFLAYEEKKYDYEEIFMVMQNIYFLRQLSKILCLFCMGMILLFTSGILYTIVFLKIKNVISQYIPMLYFLVDYWILPFIIAGLLGYLLTLLIHSKKIYALLILASIAMGPMLSIVIEPLLNLDKSGYRYASIFNLGVIKYNEGFNTMFGYPLEQVVLFVRICYMLGIFLFIFKRAIEWQIENYKKFILLFLQIFGFGFIILGGFINYHYIVEHRDFDINKKYSKIYNKENYGINNMQYRLQKYKVILKDSNQIDVKVSVQIQIQEETKHLNFNLYSGFKVKSIKIDGKECEFSKEVDDIRILLEEKLEKEEVIEVTFQYKGIPFNTLYKDSKNWVIPAFVTWLPTYYSGNSLFIDDATFVHFHSAIFPYEVEYDVQYKGKHKLYCSLEEVKKNHWMGKSSGMVTIGNTHMVSFIDKKQRRYYYPEIYKDYEEYAPKLIDMIIKHANVIGKDFQKEQNFDAEKIFFMSGLTFVGHGDEIFLFQDHMIVWVSGNAMNGQRLGDDAYLTYWALIDKVLKVPEWEKQDPEVVSIFLYSYAQTLFQRHIFEENYPLYTLEEVIERGILGEEGTKTTKKINQYLKSHTIEENLQFIRNYYKKLCLSKRVTGKEVKQLVEG